MKTKGAWLFFIFNFLFLIFVRGGLSLAEIKDMGFNNCHTISTAIRSNEHEYDLYLIRSEGYIDCRLPQINRIVRIAPFFEYQSNLNNNTWWRKELGAELGSSFFGDILYLGSAFQHVWQKEENYPIELLDETTECKARVVITPPLYLKWKIFQERLKLRIFDEYTYDFNRGQVTFNDVGVSFDWQIREWLKMPIGWRHIDRIHDVDNDMLEFSLLFSF